MAGKHEQARGDGDRTDGALPSSGEFVDSDIPGERRSESEERVGEYTASDIPGENGADDTTGHSSGEGAYEDSDVPGETTRAHDASTADDGEVGQFTDSDVREPGQRHD